MAQRPNMLSGILQGAMMGGLTGRQNHESYLRRKQLADLLPGTTSAPSLLSGQMVPPIAPQNTQPIQRALGVPSTAGMGQLQLQRALEDQPTAGMGQQLGSDPRELLRHLSSKRNRLG